MTIAGTWTDSFLTVNNRKVHIRDCFHVSFEKNIFYTTRNNTKTLTFLKANFLFLTLRIHPHFFPHVQTMICTLSSPNVKLEYLPNMSQRSRTEKVTPLIFTQSTINSKNIPMDKLKPDELCLKYKRLKFVLRDRKLDIVSLTFLLFDSSGKVVGEWRSKDISIRFGNVQEHTDLKGIPAKERDREFSDDMYNEVLQFQKRDVLGDELLCLETRLNTKGGLNDVDCGDEQRGWVSNNGQNVHRVDIDRHYPHVVEMDSHLPRSIDLERHYPCKVDTSTQHSRLEYRSSPAIFSGRVTSLVGYKQVLSPVLSNQRSSSLFNQIQSPSINLQQPVYNQIKIHNPAAYPNHLQYSAIQSSHLVEINRQNIGMGYNQTSWSPFINWVHDKHIHSPVLPNQTRSQPLYKQIQPPSINK
ncbi:hypothetical protein HDV01_003610 [Terramyces sp. JEL0728]|nr:hypothetical protein HDV01_003610 [Terramyces sp. JEL0728]